MPQTSSSIGFRWPLPVRGDKQPRPPAGLLERLSTVSSATACATLHQMGITRTFIAGPTPLRPGHRIVGPALTLQFMPQREDIASGVQQEHIEKHTALWHVLEAVQPGDILAIQAFSATHTGCLGEMLTRYFRRQGGAGIVVDGRIRDSPKIAALEVPVWCAGATPHYASQTELFPWGYDVPISCGGVLILPGDIIIADDDGAVVIPIHLAEQLANTASQQEEWEAFSRIRIDAGGELTRYYPIDDDTRSEYREWQRSRQNASGPARPSDYDGGQPER